MTAVIKLVVHYIAQGDAVDSDSGECEGVFLKEVSSRFSSINFGSRS